MGKKGKKGKKDKKVKKGKKGKGKKGKGKKGKKASTAPVAVAPVAAPVVEEPKPSPCDKRLRPEEPCEYNIDECCKEEVACRPNHYPGILPSPQAIAVVGSECGTYSSLCKLLHAGFRCADRVFAMTPWGNYVVFSVRGSQGHRIFFLFDGCCCNVNRFRYLDLSCGTAGLLYFDKMHDVLTYLIESRKQRQKMKKIRKSVIDDICAEFCEYGGRHGEEQ